ncbi:DTW domain protein [Variibacter gotjawalensis]|uniref:tRNA-uridine aminocarboxypropyltransferase n=1 Tax=Variibacter gotjawalensis TaxID=1333996 RepID=A0A0S3PXV9_9BRAD|nr:tRNA-uridine aminocarboxypropyltransferase [Variibacter gotjawalensis]NIK46542.1 hypothetical protein [Variibacter gotjawalensis]RZS48447.1 hypothetical protein EV661_0860 [Variibacter gotjawalensis]BAT60708.1 DTW domain protein [Variibacter gotjawalensis]
MTTADASTDCPRCHKPQALCVCDSIAVEKNRIALLVLQHPQEQDRTLGTAFLAAASLTNAQVRIGLSWPSLSKALGAEADPKRWAVLYLGSSKAETLAPNQDVVFLSRKGEADPNQSAGSIDGVILLDGTWSQAKALWWRNAWLLKCRRVILGPKRPSRYGKLRREPRRDGLSTIEAAGMLLARLEGKTEIETTLNTNFEKMLARYREVAKSA